MTVLSQIKSYSKPVPLKIYADFEPVLESVKANKGFYSKKYKGDNLAKNPHTNNQQQGIDCLKARSNKNERECKKCGCDYIYVPNY